ncbi:MAG: hypothetical protein ACI9VR_003613, partial [Cognaticolwellia sp.]
MTVVEASPLVSRLANPTEREPRNSAKVYLHMNKKKLLRVALGLGLGLGLVEGAAWAVDGGGFPVFNRFVADAELGVRLDPGASTRLTFRGNTSEIQINESGYRGQDWGLSEEGEVLIVGDSQVFGLGVNNNETHSVQLADISGRKVLNGGVITYGPSEYRAVVAEQLAARDGITEVVVVYNFANDPFELGNPNTGRHKVVDGWALRKELAPESVVQFPGRSWMMGRSHAIYHLRKLWHAGDQQSPNLPSEGDFQELILAQLAGENQARKGQELQAMQSQDYAQQRGLLSGSGGGLGLMPWDGQEPQARRSRDYARQHALLSDSESQLALMLWEIEHPDQDPIDAIQEKLAPESPYLDILYPRNVEAARPVPDIAALLLTSAQRLQGAEEKLGAWASAHPGARAHEVTELLEKRRKLRLDLEISTPIYTADAAPASPFWTELVALQALCAEHGASLTVVGLPLDVQVDSAEWDKYDQPRQDMSETLILIDALMEDADRLGLRHLNLSPVLLAAQPGAFLDGDLHMSAKGNAAVAQALDTTLKTPAPMAKPAPGIPQGHSRPPTWDEVRRLPENSVSGSSRNLCVTHQVREWLSVRCFVPLPLGGPTIAAARIRTQEGETRYLSAAENTWTPQSLSLLNAPLNTLTLAAPGEQISVLLPLSAGRDADLDFHWSNRTERLEVRWEGETPNFAFVDKRPSSSGTFSGPSRTDGLSYSHSVLA